MSETDALLRDEGVRNHEIPTIWQLVSQGGYIVNITGSTARDHLANERTYLAWIRTALALTGVGIGLLKYVGLNDIAGYLVIALGIFVLLNSSLRYFRVMLHISHGTFETNVRSVLAFVAMILIVIYTASYEAGLPGCFCMSAAGCWVLGAVVCGGKKRLMQLRKLLN